jgi:hypothetical protein
VVAVIEAKFFELNWQDENTLIRPVFIRSSDVKALNFAAGAVKSGHGAWSFLETLSC